MIKSMKWLGATAALTTLAALSMGCVGADDDGEDVDEARLAQTPPVKEYSIYEILDDSGFQRGKMLATVTSGAGFDADREYYFMTSNLSNDSAATFVLTRSDYWTNPPSSLGTPSFAIKRTPTWTSATPRGTMLLNTNPLTGERTGINWQMTNSSGVWTGAIYWWHSSATYIFGAGTSTRLAPGTPGSGSWYQFTTTPL